MARLAALALLFAACGGAQRPKSGAASREDRCRQARAHQTAILAMAPSPDDDRVAIARCVDKMTEDALVCFTAAKTKDDLDRCDAIQKDTPDSDAP